MRGTRVNLGQKLTEEICKSRVNRRIYPWTIGIQNRAETAIHSTPVSNFFADRYKKNVSSGLGCNMSFWRSDFLAINGYDEFFEGWGKEDDDLTHRLQRKGCKKRSLRFAGIVYHLWHGHESMESDQKNAEYFRKNNEKNIVYCENGVSKYLKQE
ncbi:galactosyltransferase-related protein [Bacteroides fragilis]|nr:galactosyltransferase-related protein [Bacteroides fragilis]